VAVVELAEDVVRERAVLGVDRGLVGAAGLGLERVEVGEGALAGLAGRARGRVLREVVAGVVDLREQLLAELVGRHLEGPAVTATSASGATATTRADGLASTMQAVVGAGCVTRPGRC
jgi:hypothetical protein